MNDLKNTHNPIRQNVDAVKTTKKHDVNLQKNSTLYFQVGLILCLLAVFGLLEMQFETTFNPVNTDLTLADDLEEVPIENFKVYEEPKLEVKPEIKKTVLLNNNLKEVDNTFEIKKVIEVITSEQNTTSSLPLDPGTLPDLDAPDDEVIIPVDYVQVVPIYPGCENKKTNDAKRKCMSEKISKLVRKKFDTDIGSAYGLTGKQVVRTHFKIDKTGRVTDIKAYAEHPALQNEAERVINKIPEMTPGKQNDKNVGVIYTLPIVFQVQ